MKRYYPRRRQQPAAPAAAVLPVTDSEKAPAVYDSWGAFVGHAEKGPSEMTDSARSSRTAYSGFSATENFAAAVELARNGWAEGTEKAAKLAYPIIDKLGAQLEREEYNYATTGVTFDVARVLEGEPECWIECQPVAVDAPGRVLRLVFNATVSGGVGTDTIVAKGAVTAALVSVLERAGFRVQVDCVIAVRSTGPGESIVHESWVPVKSASQDMDLARLTFALAHPAMLRRMWFSSVETLSAAMRQRFNIGSGYGVPSECATDKQGDIYIGRSGYNDPQWADSESATAWIIGQLAQQGIRVNQAPE